MKLNNYNSEIEESIILFAATLNERDLRRYAGVEALKLGHGGISYLSKLLKIDPKTISKGIKEIKKPLNIESIRQAGAGRPYIEENYPNIHEVFLEIISKHTAGCPMNEDIRWTYLSQEEIVEKLADKGIQVSTFTVRTLLKIHKFKKRKMAKCKTIKDVVDRDKQFKNIERLRAQFIENGEPIISIDSKKKEPFGALYRDGEVYSQEALKVYDHDFSSLQTGLVVPHGIYDIVQNKAFINLNSSKDTANFVYDSLLLWWQNYGNIQYPNANNLLIFCDGGGSNSCRHYVFKEAIQKLATRIKITIRITHYPSYCSKYNPIEHKVFPYVTKALDGIVLHNVETVKELIENRAKTKTGLKVFANIIDNIYQTGKKATKSFLENMPIVFDNFLPKWNYKAVPEF